jgi:DNA-binding HxlR family transcriptional regulator
MVTTAERFAELFRGYTARHGRYEVNRQETSGKLTGRANTVDSAPSLEDYEAHLKGEYSIGIIPLSADERVYFSAIDIDKYQGLSHRDLTDRLQQLPVIVTRSKSNGAHIWLFTPHGAAAETVIRVMKQWAGELGFGDSEIFPKQMSRKSKEDVGNWINLPYFGATRNGIMVDKKGALVELTLEEFVAAAEDCGSKATNEFLENIAPKIKSQRSGSASKIDYEDGPYCIQKIVSEGGPIEGSRNEFFFNAAVYLARKYGNESTVREKLMALNYGSPEVFKGKAKCFESLPDGEVQRTIKSAMGKEYSYACNKAPLCSFCVREQCLKRPFGVGSSELDLPVEIGGFTKILTEPPLYLFNVNGVRVELKSSRDLLNQTAFRAALVDAASVVLPYMNQNKFDQLVQSWLSSCEDEEPPPDSDPMSMVLDELVFFLDRFKAREKSQVAQGRVYWDEDEGFAIFKLNDFQRHLKNNRIVVEQRALTQFFKRNGLTHKETTIQGKSVRIWLAPLAVHGRGRDVE